MQTKKSIMQTAKNVVQTIDVLFNSKFRLGGLQVSSPPPQHLGKKVVVQTKKITLET
jgi:hypothetical protein